MNTNQPTEAHLEVDQPRELYMENAELRIKRSLLGLSLNDLDRLSTVQLRTAARWESGRYHVPKDVAENINDLWQELIEAVEGMARAADAAHEKTIRVPLYANECAYMDAHGGSTFEWRLYTAQVAAAYLLLNARGYQVEPYYPQG